MRELTPRRTWPPRPSLAGGGPDWTPLGAVSRDCGCVWDTLSDRMWRPCVVHEAEGHLSAISDDADRGLTVARCLVRNCDWTTAQYSEVNTVLAAQDHWAATRGAISP